MPVTGGTGVALTLRSNFLKTELDTVQSGVIIAGETEAGGPIESGIQEQSGKYTKMVLKRCKKEGSRAFKNEFLGDWECNLGFFPRTV